MTSWTRTHRIEAESPGIFMSEDSRYTVSERTVEAALAVVADSVFRFRFYDALEAQVEVDGEPQTVRKVENHSPWHYLGGTIYTLDEVRDLDGVNKDLSILVSNMEANRWGRVIQTPFGNWHPWEDDFIRVPVGGDGPGAD